MIVLEDTETPPFEDVLNVISWLNALKYSTFDLHNEIAEKMTLSATRHSDRASKLCTIESDKGIKTPKQMELIDQIIKTLNQEK